ncbi:hypothetical protein DKK68_06435 [Bifidobacterium asteroides]|uniref:hypothetical protein n=1 Tax=Bifidobacterium asteroides TaxID=1684 RepID=UPI000D78BA3D|nr:hypothetical protein [Bifidobacterium asteroides]PXY87393.1 hypothetical protein DKK68_06435 [Bifidobacterium asteroides]
MSEWYSNLKPEEIKGKRVRAVLSSGTVVEGCLEYWDNGLASIGSLSEGNYVLRGSEKKCWKLTAGVKRLDLVWDERDWKRIDAEDLRAGDAVVANGRLYKVSWAHVGPPQVVTDTPGRMLIDLRLVSCALRRKVNVPAKPGFYKDTLGEFWARAAKSTDDRPWRSVEPDALDQPAKSDKYMANLMPLTPVHFVDGRAPEPGDELASVMRVTSKGVTFTTEAA